jgi:hypothetical protein
MESTKLPGISSTSAGWRLLLARREGTAMLPPPIHCSSEEVVFKAPQIVLHPELRNWLA